MAGMAFLKVIILLQYLKLYKFKFSLFFNLNLNGSRCDMLDCMKVLRESGIKSVLVEGGSSIIKSVLDLQLCNQLIVTIRPCYLGGYRILTDQLSRPINLFDVVVATVGGDVMIFGEVMKILDPSSDDIYDAQDCERLLDSSQGDIRSAVKILIDHDLSKDDNFC